MVDSIALQGNMPELRRLCWQRWLLVHLLTGLGAAVLIGLLWQGWSPRLVCGVLGGLCLLGGVLRLTLRKPLCFLWPGLQELYRFEQHQMGSSFPRYYESGALTLLFLSALCGAQTVFRSSTASWFSAAPASYWTMATTSLVALLLLVNLHFWLHARWLQRWSAEKWVAYGADRQLFLRVLLGVLLVTLLLGTMGYAMVLTLPPPA